jgi:hypothetical protein
MRKRLAAGNGGEPWETSLVRGMCGGGECGNVKQQTACSAMK